MTARITDRDQLARTLEMLEGSKCCEFFACPGPNRRPVPMASCAQATAVYELRQYLRRNGGWCPEHGQRLDRCHPPEDRPDPKAEFHWRQCGPHHICCCQPVSQTRAAA